MIVALSTQVYGSDNKHNHDESHFQKIQCYQEIISDIETYTIRSINKEQNYPTKWISTNEFFELGNQSWNNNDLVRKNVYTAVAYKYIAPDYLTLKISKLIKYDAQNIMNKSQHCLENIIKLLSEKEMLQNMVDIENELIAMLTES